MNLSNIAIPKSESRNALLDVMRFIFAILIVVLHSNIDLGVFSPILRIPVPVFFISSGYFLFKKQINVSKQDANIILYRYVKRNMQLYMFWFIALLPVTLVLRDWFSGSIVLFVQSFLFNSTFRASWFLMAMNLGAVLVVLISRKIGTKKTLYVGLGIYGICCLFSNYFKLMENFESILYCYELYITVFRSLVNSFPVAFFWLAVGKYLAEKEMPQNKCYWNEIGISMLLLLAEGYVIRLNQLSVCDDCYIMLVPVCIYLFRFSLQYQIRWKPNLRMTYMSTIIYAVHASIIPIIEWLLKKLGMEIPVLTFGITFVICVIGCYIIFKLETVKYFRWLKYSY